MSDLFLEPNSANTVVEEPQDFDELTEYINSRFNTLEAQINGLTGSVNSIGAMIDHMVQQVSGFGQMVQKQGLGGILGMLGGKS